VARVVIGSTLVRPIVTAQTDPAPRAASPTRGIALAVAAVSLFPVMDGLVKYISADYHVTQIVWARYVFHLVVVVAVALRGRVLHYAKTRRLGLQLLRSVLLMAATVIFFAALQFVPLADAVAVNFTAPLFVVAFSIPLLGERVDGRRWLAVAVGFAAVLVIVRPGLGLFHWASLMPVGSACCYALYQIITRRLAALDHPYTTLFYLGAVGAPCFSLAMPFVWTNPDAADWALLVTIGCIGGLSQYLLIRAFQHAPASTLAPFSYLQIVSATLVGYLLFGDFPDRWTFVGAALLILCGLSLARHETLAGRAVTERPKRG